MLEGKGAHDHVVFFPLLIILSLFLCSPLPPLLYSEPPFEGSRDQRNLSARVFLLPVIKRERREFTQKSQPQFFY